MKGMIKYLTKQDIELKAQKLRSFSYPGRKMFNMVEPEQVIYDSFEQDELMFTVDNLPEGLLGKCELSETGRGRIIIDERHYLRDNQTKVNFSIGHELGHFVFHSRYLGEEVYKTVKNGLPKFDDAQSAKNHSQLEWQANYFASALQMPVPDMDEFHRTALSKLPYFPRFEHNADKKLVYYELGEAKTQELIEEFARRLNVSPVAFSIRLSYLGILNLNGRGFYKYNKYTNQYEPSF